jgi:hypothetical protein
MTPRNIKEMHVKNISVNPLCNGPLEYHIHWQCWNCKNRDTLIKQASLLPDDQAVCSHCGKTNQYVYDASISQGDEKLSDKINAMEKALFQELHAKPHDCIFLLGHNFLFGVFAYLANTLRVEDV